MNFIGEECIICHKKFSDDDDIVVCEVCGTPYHRECYKTFNKCVNYDLHEKGLSFQPTVSQQKQEQEQQSHIEETSTNNNDSLKSATLNYDSSYSKVIDMSREILNRMNLNPNEEINGVSLLEFYLYTNSLSNTRKFLKLKDNPKKSIFNIFALLIPEYYLASKKMYVETIFVVLINLFLETPLLIQNYSQLYNNQFDLLVNNSVFQIIGNISLILLLIFRIFTSFSILPRYFQKTVDNIKRIKSHFTNNDIYLKKLAQIRNGLNLWIILIVMFSSEILKVSLYVLVSLLYNMYI